jgi:predicted regulator of Ras-like GTPase activity (Roadblock/LC7/MglB family)
MKDIMKETLKELKENIGGIIGHFVIDENRNVIARDVPKLMTGAIDKSSKPLHYIINVIKTAKTFDRIIIDCENAKLIAMPTGDRILVVIAEKNINLPLLRLLSNMAVSKIKDAPVAVSKNVSKTESQTADVPVLASDKLCNLYDSLFGIAAEKLTIFYGADVIQMFDEPVKEVKEKHPKLLKNVGLGEDGKPEIAKLKTNAKNLSKEKLIAGLEDLLLAMLEAVKSNVGPSIADETINEIIKMRETALDRENIQMPPLT